MQLGTDCSYAALLKHSCMGGGGGGGHGTSLDSSACMSSSLPATLQSVGHAVTTCIVNYIIP